MARKGGQVVGRGRGRLAAERLLWRGESDRRQTSRIRASRLLQLSPAPVRSNDSVCRLLKYATVPANILFSFAGFHDPYTKTAVEGEEQRGPVLTALTAHEFDRVILFGTPRTLTITAATAEALRAIAPEMDVEIVPLSLQDPTDYTQIIVSLRAKCGEIMERFPTARLFVSTASGTPQMHACWLLLAASGELPARLLHTRPPQFVSDEKPMVSEVDVLGTPFPKVVPVASGIDFSTPDFQAGPNLNDVLEEIGIVAEHPRMRFALETARSCAEYDCPVLITGETGTGKDLFAKLIHRLSSRSAQPFVVVNCSAIPENLVESTLLDTFEARLPAQ